MTGACPLFSIGCVLFELEVIICCHRPRLEATGYRCEGPSGLAQRAWQ